MKQSIALLILSIVLSPISSFADSECYYTRQCLMNNPGTPNCKPDDTKDKADCTEQPTTSPYRCQVSKQECGTTSNCKGSNTCYPGDSPRKSTRCTAKLCATSAIANNLPKNCVDDQNYADTCLKLDNNGKYDPVSCEVIDCDNNNIKELAIANSYKCTCES